MNTPQFGLLRFEEAYFERIWGGAKLHTLLGKDTPPDKVIGEAWLVSDHAEHESVVADGAHQGRSLRELVETAPQAVLGSRARRTPDGRFPLLLKLLDSAQSLSVQVHPDDATAKRLGEPDVGKTEMWHVFDADPGSELICGLDPAVGPEEFASSVADGSIERTVTRFNAPAGTTAFVAAGTVHAIGGGILLAEIQQNSNITYRIYDWGRVDTDGNPRELHVEKALEATHFGSPHGGPAHPLAYPQDGATIHVLAACRHFAAELIEIENAFTRPLSGGTFHLVLAKTGALEVHGGDTAYTLAPGEVVLLPGCLEAYTVAGPATYLDYYVPDLERDVVEPLLAAGHSPEAIVRLGGAPGTSDLSSYIR